MILHTQYNIIAQHKSLCIEYVTETQRGMISKNNIVVKIKKITKLL